MMALEEPESESDNGGPPVWDRKRIAAVMRNRWQKVRAAALKPPPSPLLNKVVAHLGRDLRPREVAYLRAVQSSFAKGARALHGTEVGHKARSPKVLARSRNRICAQWPD